MVNKDLNDYLSRKDGMLTKKGLEPKNEIKKVLYGLGKNEIIL